MIQLPFPVNRLAGRPLTLNLLDDFLLLSTLIYGEAVGESYQGKIAVAWVVRNRVKANSWWGSSWKAVMLKAKQFSCFNEDYLPKLIARLNRTYNQNYCSWVDCT